MFSSTSQMVIILLWFLCAITLNSGLGHGNLNVRCNGKDQHVLSVFKQSIRDPSKRLSSWSTEEDCCKWTGVQCHNITGRVTKLDLHCPPGDDMHDDIGSRCLGGEINFSVFELEFLSVLDLSWNDFKAIHFPPTPPPGSPNNQRSHNSSLRTSSATNFSNLLYLDLSGNSNLHMDNLRWVSRLSSLKYLNLTGIILSNETLWLQRITMLPSLIELRLSGCFLNGTNPPLGYANLTSLAVLDISNNFFDSEVPKWLFNLSSSISYIDLRFNDLQGQIPATMLTFQHLNTLILSDNKLSGSIPEWMGQYKHLEFLDLSNNLFSGPIPVTLGNLSALTYLDVSNNRLNGSFPRDLGQLSKLETLTIGYNSLSGILSEQCFTKLSNLKSLQFDSSAFIFHLGSHWLPPFQLERISLSYCKLGPEFPSWLYTQRSLSYLDISSSGLSFNVHDEFWSFVAQIDHLYLANNSISGDISTALINNTSVDLNSNNFRGRLPRLSPKVAFFNIANNSFSGPISPLLCQSMAGKQELAVLDMSQNLLSGEFPDCWMHWKSLIYVNLGRNNVTGKIPDSMGSLIKLQTLRLRNNSLSGNIPPSLKSCVRLWFLDLGFNEFTGNVPSWVGNLSMALLLRSNRLNGSIPSHICKLSNLLVLDLANNRLSGPIPKCLSKITTMVTGTVDEGLFDAYFFHWDLAPFLVTSYLEDITLFMKGQDRDYQHAFKLVRFVDLSSNDLSGSIPPELFSLIALQSLNLSHNHLMGSIPSDIGHMRFLESLDLSRNLLSGEIPQSMSNLSFLGYLNLSYNNFNGRIPLGTQLQTFEPSSYIGNRKLCGAPLPKNCEQEEKPYVLKSMEDNDGDFTSWFNIGMEVGFVYSFCGFCGTLYYIRTWRHAYFQILDKLYVIIALKMNRLL